MMLVLPAAVINYLSARGPDSVLAIPICSLCALKMDGKLAISHSNTNLKNWLILFSAVYI